MPPKPTQHSVLVAFVRQFVPADVLLLLADEAPYFIELKAADPEGLHRLVVKAGAAVTDAAA